MVNVTFLPIYNDKNQLLGECLVIMYQQCSLRKVFVLFCWSVVVINKIHKKEDRGRWGAEVIVCNISWLFSAHFQNMSLEDNFPATSFNASLNTDILGSENDMTHFEAILGVLMWMTAIRVLLPSLWSLSSSPLLLLPLSSPLVAKSDDIFSEYRRCVLMHLQF